MFVVGTKGQEDLEVERKDRRARRWCADATSLTGQRWSFLKVPEAVFRGYQVHDFTQLHALLAGPGQSAEPHWGERIVRDPNVLGGEPFVRGTRISVRSVVLTSREYGGVSGVLDAYPQLSRDDIEAALAFYSAHQAEIDWHIRANVADD